MTQVELTAYCVENLVKGGLRVVHNGSQLYLVDESNMVVGTVNAHVPYNDLASETYDPQPAAYGGPNY